MSRQFPNFKQFLDERVGDDYLYHNTDVYALQDILKSGKLGKTKWVSLTRSKNYSAAPGAGKREVRLVFDRMKLKSRYKMVPTVDRGVVSNSTYRGSLVTQPEARWESEERVKGPIRLKDALVEIQIDPKAKAYREKLVFVWKNSISEIEKQIQKLENGVFWNNVKKAWVPLETEKQKRVHNPKKYKEMIKRLEAKIDEEEMFLNHPKLKVVNL